MQIDFELIETLVLKEISGDLTSSEVAFLRELLQSDDQARQLAETIRSKVIANDVNRYLLTNNKDRFTHEVLRKIHGRKKRFRNTLQYISISVAASFMFLACLWYFFIYRRDDVTMTSIATYTTSTPSIILSLPDGKQMQLDSTDQQLQVGGISVNTKSRTLTYTTNGGADAKFAILTVPVGKDYKIKLQDGSEIHLNAATRLRFPLTFDGHTREITIDGEAYLNVAHNTDRPFIVHLPKGTVEVLGTEFNINTYDSAIEKISLVTGSLRIKTTAHNALLKPGTEALATVSEIGVRSFSPEEVLSWREGRYYIDNLTLSQLSAVVSRWYGCKIVVDTKEAAMQRFSGTLYRNQPVDVMLRSIQLTNTIRYSTDANGIIHIK